jgi:hypothetical protein
MEEEDKTGKITEETEEEINNEYKNSTRKEEEEEDEGDLYFVSSEDEGEEEEEINMNENNIIGMNKNAEDIRYAPEEEIEENSANSPIIDKKKERTIGKLMTTSKAE